MIYVTKTALILCWYDYWTRLVIDTFVNDNKDRAHLVIFAKHNYKVIHIAQVGDCWIINPTMGLYENNYVFMDYHIK